MERALRGYLTELDSDLEGYRERLNRVFSRKLTKPWHCARYFFDLLVFTSRIYGHNLTLRQMERVVPTRPSQSHDMHERGIDIEFALRKKFKARIESLAC